MRSTVVITDTSCLIALTKVSALGVLRQLYEEVVVTEEVADEFGEPLPEWIRVKTVENKTYQQLLEAALGRGEASAIALAISIPDALLIVDDLKARKEAVRLGLKITGTLGVLLKAKQQGLISSIKTLFDKLEQDGFRISSEVRNEILQASAE